METLYTPKPKLLEERGHTFEAQALPLSTELKERLERHQLLQAFIADSLPPYMLGSFKHGNIIGDTLTLHFNHPSAKLEFKGAKLRILERMRELYRERGLKEVFTFKKLECLVDYAPLSSPAKVDKALRFAEQSRGEFVNLAVKGSRIYELFEEIRLQIIKNVEQERREERLEPFLKGRAE